MLQVFATLGLEFLVIGLLTFGLLWLLLGA